MVIDPSIADLISGNGWGSLRFPSLVTHNENIKTTQRLNGETTHKKSQEKHPLPTMRFMPKRGQQEKEDHEKIRESLTTKSARWPPVADRFLNFR